MALYIVGPYNLFYYEMWFDFDFSKFLWYKDHRFVVSPETTLRGA